MNYNYGQSRSRYPISSGMPNGEAAYNGDAAAYNGGASYNNCAQDANPCGDSGEPPIDVNGPEVAQLVEDIVAQYADYREPRVIRQVCNAPAGACGPGQVLNITRRLPEQAPDQIERIICATAPQDLINLYIEKPSTPPAVINTQEICKAGRPPLIQPYLVNVGCSGSQQPVQPMPAGCMPPPPGCLPQPAPAYVDDVGSAGMGVSPYGMTRSPLGMGTSFGRSPMQSRAYAPPGGIAQAPVMVQQPGGIRQGMHMTRQALGSSIGRSIGGFQPQPQMMQQQQYGRQWGMPKTGGLMGMPNTGQYMSQPMMMQPQYSGGYSSGYGQSTPYAQTMQTKMRYY